VRISRRAWLGNAALLPLLAGEVKAQEASRDSLLAAAPVVPLGRGDFQLGAQTYIDAASTHPMSIHAAAAMRRYLSGRMSPGHGEEGARRDPRAQFARLINASPQEIAVIPSTLMGENFLINALGLRGSRDRVVTDALHFIGSLYMYDELAKEGLDVRTVQARGHIVDLDDFAALITKRTRLVAVSLVSLTTGFKHDLKALCELAHSRGALVYADIIQAAGNLPIDVRESNVDFAACATYKWLMGDFGVGFMYTREDHLQRIRRPVFGYQQMDFDMRKLPYDPASPKTREWTQRQDGRGRYEAGSEAAIALAAVQDSIERIMATGVDQIAARRQPLIDFVRAQLPVFDFEPLAPVSNSALACFVYRNAAQILAPKLRKANVAISVYEHRIRISPSVYNDMSDMERLVDVLTS
jgi:selenocysteine lyase/cysteine desulfurase